jgi:uncharacterized protein YecE (DUF72 family)
MRHAIARRIHVGTSGWSYAHWRGPFYPSDLPEGEWLAYYGERLHTVEINNTFHQLPTQATLRGWREAVAEDFVFSVKASRFITHMKKLREPEVTLANFFERIAALAPRLGPILFQLPPRWRLDLERLRHFLAALPGEYRYAFEFRDRSWWNPAVYDLLAHHEIAFCIHDLGGMLSPREVTSDIVYVRLHGPEGPYRGCYDSATVAAWVEAFSGWAAQGRAVYCYFDNDQRGYAVLNALQMQERIRSALL